MTCTLFLGLSLDGYIADRQGGLDWLEGGSRAGEPADDGGYPDQIAQSDCIVMGRHTFETVLGFGIDWPYSLPVVVLSRSLAACPPELAGKAEVMAGTPAEIVERLATRGWTRLYIDGGRTAQAFLAAGLIDRMTLTRIPVVLGGGVALFGDLAAPLWFDPTETRTLSRGYVQTTYERRKEPAK